MPSHFNKVNTVLVIGPGGSVGTFAIKHLLAKGFQVSGLSRESSRAELSAGVNHLRTDYSPESLEAAFRGQDAVISTVSGGGLELQKTIVDAAIAAGVKIFFPSEYGVDTSAPEAPELVPLLKMKVEVLDYIKSKEEKMSWTALVIGSLFDWGLDIPGFGGLDVPARTATIYDGGDVPYEATTSEQVGRAIVAALEHPDAVRNRYVFVNSFTVTQNQVTQALERATGDSFTVSHDSVHHLRETGQKQMQDGYIAGLLAVIASVFYSGSGVADYSTRKELWTERLGLPQEDLDSVVKSYIARG